MCVWALGGGGSLAQQLQVSDRDFALLVPSFSNQPVGVHSWDGVDGDKLQEGEKRHFQGHKIVLYQRKIHF